MMNKWIVWGMMQWIVFAAIAQNKAEIAKNEIVSDPYFANALIGISVIDLSTGEQVISHQAALSMPTASTAKLFSTASAFEILGEEYRPKTKIYTDGEITKEGIVRGNLWIRGAGDVSLGSRYYNDPGKEEAFLSQWADTLLKMGITAVEGDIIGDASAFGYNGAPDGWSWNDMGNYYGAGPSGLSIYDNMLKYYFKTGANGTTPVLTRTFPVLEHFTFNNYIKSSPSKGDNSYIYGAPYSADRFGTGLLQMNTSIMVKGSIPDPEITFSAELKRVLIEKGVTVAGIAKGARSLPEITPGWKRYKDFSLLYTYAGERLSSVAFWTNQKSVNLFAEELVCWIGYDKNGDGSTDNGLKQMMQYWEKKINTGGLYLKDGSGLSRSNAISAGHLTALLSFMYTSKNYAAFRSTLPVAGVSGTLSEVCRNQAAQGKIAAKSGTMQRIKSYAGYVTSSNGKEYAFAIIFNNYNSSNSYLMGKIEKFMNAMVIQE